jgi:asparagine synthetase B (glutamine-hydrolysing)
MSSVSDADRIHSFTNVAPVNASGMASAPDEWSYASAVVSHCGIRNAVRVSQGVWTDPFHPLDLHISDHSGVDIISPFWLEPARRLMREKGIRICLSGFFGDEVATHPARLHYHDLIDDGRLLLYLRACLEHGDYTLPLRRLAGAMMPEPVARWFRRSPASLTPDAGYLLGIPPSARMTRPEGRPGPFNQRRQLLGLATGLHPRRRMQNESIAAIRHRLVPRYPFADIRLVELVLSLPAEYTGRAGTDRYMYRGSLSGIVPEKVRLRTDKQMPTGLFPVHELMAVSRELRGEMALIGKSVRHPLALRLDFDRIDRDLDPGHPANRWEGGFFPKVPFHILALARYFDARGK